MTNKINEKVVKSLEIFIEAAHRLIDVFKATEEPVELPNPIPEVQSPVIETQEVEEVPEPVIEIPEELEPVVKEYVNLEERNIIPGVTIKNIQVPALMAIYKLDFPGLRDIINALAEITVFTEGDTERLANGYLRWENRLKSALDKLRNKGFVVVKNNSRFLTREGLAYLKSEAKNLNSKLLYFFGLIDIDTLIKDCIMFSFEDIDDVLSRQEIVDRAYENLYQVIEPHLEELNSDGLPKWQTRVYFNLSDLRRDYGAIENVRRGMWKLSEKGADMVYNDGPKEWVTDRLNKIRWE